MQPQSPNNSSLLSRLKRHRAFRWFLWFCSTTAIVGGLFGGLSSARDFFDNLKSPPKIAPNTVAITSISAGNINDSYNTTTNSYNRHSDNFSSNNSDTRIDGKTKSIIIYPYISGNQASRPNDSLERDLGQTSSRSTTRPDETLISKASGKGKNPEPKQAPSIDIGFLYARNPNSVGEKLPDSPTVYSNQDWMYTIRPLQRQIEVGNKVAPQFQTTFNYSFLLPDDLYPIQLYFCENGRIALTLSTLQQTKTRIAYFDGITGALELQPDEMAGRSQVLSCPNKK